MKTISQIDKGVGLKMNLSISSGIHQWCDPRFVRYFFTFLPYGKAGGFQIRRCQGLAVNHYGVTLGALTLKPSDFYSIGVKPC
jgi:hypothetical protein